MNKYDILKNGAIEEAARGMAVTAFRDGLMKIVSRREAEKGKLTEFALEEACEMAEEEVILDGLKLDNVTMTASKTNNIVKTAINGRFGTVKEYVSEGDVAIGMTVTLLSEDNEYPWSMVDELKEVLNQMRTLEVVSRWLNDVWDVTRVVVENYSMTGHTERNYEVVEVNLASDKEYLIVEGMEE